VRLNGAKEQPRRLGMKAGSTLLYLADSILYLSSMLRDQPRRIDRYIDYFGDWPAGAVPAVVRSRRTA